MTDQQQIDNDEISLKELIQKIKEWITYLTTQWKLIIGIAVLGGILGFTYASFQKPTYIATLTFALDEEKGNSSNAISGLASNLGIDVGNNAGGIFSESNLVELMKSKLIIEKTLLTKINLDNHITTLADYYFTFNNINNENNNIFSTPKSNSFNYKKDSILDLLYNKVTSNSNLRIYNKEKSSSITTIEITSNSEIFSKLFCENLINEVSNYYIEIKSKKATINVAILQKQVDSIRMELNNAINGVATLNDNIYNLNPAFNIKKTPSTKRQIDVQANSAILNQLINNLELSKMTLLKETPLFQIIDKPKFPLKDNKISKLFIALSCAFATFILTCLSIIFHHSFKKGIYGNE